MFCDKLVQQQGVNIWFFAPHARVSYIKFNPIWTGLKIYSPFPYCNWRHVIHMDQNLPW